VGRKRKLGVDEIPLAKTKRGKRIEGRRPKQTYTTSLSRPKHRLGKKPCGGTERGPSLNRTEGMKKRKRTGPKKPKDPPQ